MKRNIGILLNSLQVPFAEGVEFAAAAGVEGIQFYATGEMDPENLNAQTRKRIRETVDKKGLVISALCGDLGGHGFEREEEHPFRIAKSRQIIELAADLGSRVVTGHIGVIRAEECRENEGMRKALTELLPYAQEHGIFYATETGPEPSAVLGEFIEELDVPGLKVNFDPANLVMVQGENPCSAAERLKNYIVHTHGKDGRQIAQGNPVLIYKAFAEGHPQDFHLDEYFLELPIGKGDVDFKGWFRTLDSIGYEGFITIEREAGTNRKNDVIQAIKYLRKF